MSDVYRHIRAEVAARRQGRERIAQATQSDRDKLIALFASERELAIPPFIHEPLADLILGSEWLEQKLRDSYYEGWSKGWDDCVAARKDAHEGAA